MTDVTFKDGVAVPHKYRNRFMKDGGVSINETSSVSSSSVDVDSLMEEIDRKYVKKSGDTMNGDLTVKQELEVLGDVSVNGTIDASMGFRHGSDSGSASDVVLGDGSFKALSEIGGGGSANCLPLSGGTMTGDIDMGGNSIDNVFDINVNGVKYDGSGATKEGHELVFDCNNGQCAFGIDDADVFYVAAENAEIDCALTVKGALDVSEAGFKDGSGDDVVLGDGSFKALSSLNVANANYAAGASKLVPKNFNGYVGTSSSFEGYKKIHSCTMSGWSVNQTTFGINSRYGGSGRYCINFKVNANVGSYSSSIMYFGTPQSHPLLFYYNKDTGLFTIWKYFSDYDNTLITLEDYWGRITINGDDTGYDAIDDNVGTLLTVNNNPTSSITDVDTLTVGGITYNAYGADKEGNELTFTCGNGQNQFGLDDVGEFYVNTSHSTINSSLQVCSIFTFGTDLGSNVNLEYLKFINENKLEIKFNSGGRTYTKYINLESS